MALRNFWLEASIDGQKTILKGGPRSYEGGMNINICQNVNGKSKVVLTVNCFRSPNGTLMIYIDQKDLVTDIEDC